MTDFDLRSVAPRLALARDQWIAEQEFDARAQSHRESEVLRLERMIAHRELQELRSATYAGAKYVRWRGRKVEAAQGELARLLKKPLPRYEPTLGGVEHSDPGVVAALARATLRDRSGR